MKRSLLHIDPDGGFWRFSRWACVAIGVLSTRSIPTIEPWQLAVPILTVVALVLLAARLRRAI